MRHLLDLDDPTLAMWMAERELPRYRVRQVRGWIHRRRVEDFQSMSDLPLALRQELTDEFRLWSSEIVAVREAADGTEKLLLELAAGGRIECVLLRDGIRRTICISSQVGCAMGCVFCASGLDGVDRNLTTGEIVEQMLLLQRRLPVDERLSHIVVMGMGEPLANLERLIPALDLACEADGLAISPRRITISTVGLPPAIVRLADERPRYHLAVSLHAPNDELRNELVPINRAIGLDRVLEAADYYFEKSGRRLTYEYVLLAEVNDGQEHARELAGRLRGRPALINVIPYNPVEGLPYRTPTERAQRRFREILEQRGLTVQFRQRKGDAISAACGQLRRRPTAQEGM
ncbi:MAG: 23S rRNA (adenine(2503)-C(2))-methyltransferase RlmN [Pirellulaceae bacterium]